MKRSLVKMNRGSACRAILASGLGYASVVVSALLLWKGSQMLTGNYPSFSFFVWALVTFRLAEVSLAFLAVPPVVAVLTMMGLSKILSNCAIVSGLGLSSYYVLAGSIMLGLGAGEFPSEIAALWILATFLLGAISGMTVNRLSGRRQMW